MDIKIIKSNRLKFVNDGAYGDYSRIKGTDDGVKVMKCHTADYSSISAVKNSYDFKQVKKEFKRLKKLNQITRCVPKAKYLAIIEEHDPYTNISKYSCGYVMSHIKGTSAHNLSDDDLDKLEAARIRLTKKGIFQIDGHGGNVIVKTVNRKKRFIFIDAGGLRFKPSDNCDWS